MAFSFTTTSEYIQKSPLEDKTDLLEGMFEAQEAYNTLLQAGVELSSTEAMLADIQETLYSISQPYVGQESLEMFGTAESFQSLYDKPIADLSRAEAMEGLGDALKKVWDKLVAWIKDIFDAIFKFIKAILFLGPRASKKADQVIQATKEPEAKEAIKEKEVPAEVMTPEQASTTAKVAEEAQAEMAQQVQAQADIESGVTKAANLMKQGKEEEANKILEELVAKVEEQDKKISETQAKVEELNKKVEDGKKGSLASKGWTPDNVAKAAGEIKKTATADSQKLAKDAEALKARNEKFRKYLINTVVFLTYPPAGVAKIGYDMANDKYKKSHGGESIMSAGRKKFGDLCRRLTTATAKAPGKICGMFSKLRKKQEKTLSSFETVLTPVTKEEIEQADAHNTNEALKKKQEEMGLETESFQVSVEGFMDLIKKAADKIKSGFSATLKKITDITTRGVNAAEKSNWNRVLGLGNPSNTEESHILTYNQATHIVTKTIPRIVQDSKQIVPVYNKNKTVEDLPKAEEAKVITEEIEKQTDWTVMSNMAYGPTADGNTGCGWSRQNTKTFMPKFLSVARAGLPPEVIKMTSDGEQSADTSVEATRSVAMAKWFIKAYGKCLAEVSKTVIKLADTCGMTEDEKQYRLSQGMSLDD